MSDGTGTLSSGFEIGVGTAEITPPIGTPLAGNFRDDDASRGVHRPLTARSLVIRSGDRAVALVVADLLTAPEVLVRRVREEIEKQCGLRPEQVLVAATHTHSGPAVENLGAVDRSAAIIEAVAPGMAASCVRAFEACRPRQLWSASATCDGVCFHRRLRLKTGATVMNWTRPPVDTVERPWGPVDPEVGVLLAGDDPVQPQVVLANLALHPAVLAGDNWLLGPDWPGEYVQAVQQILGPGTEPLFLQGAEGNVNHIDYGDPQQGRGFKEAQRIGLAVGLAAASARFTARPVTGPIAWSSTVVDLPPRRLTEDQRAQARRIVAASQAAGAAPRGQVDGIPEVVFATDQLAMAERVAPYRAEVQVLRLGDVAVVGLPGEFFVEFGLELKRRSPARMTVVAGLANGSLGYVPVPEAFAAGGYEPTPWRYSKLSPEAGAICLAAAQTQLQALFGRYTLV
jgi:neutral ceramidase